MLKLLKIKNIALDHGVELELGPGLTLLTGETGAGKSILIDALGLLLGARASADLIRTGEDVAVVEALIESADARAALERHGLPAEDDEIVVRREIQSSGKGRATVNGALVPVGVLRELAPFIANIHGQHEPQGLLDPQTHLDLVDHHAGLDADRAAMAEPFRRLREVEAAIESLHRDRREGERRREMLEYQAVEIERAALQTGEEEALRQEKRLQANAGRLAELSGEAYGALYEDEEAVLTRLGHLYRKIEELSRIDPRFAPSGARRRSRQLTTSLFAALPGVAPGQPAARRDRAGWPSRAPQAQVRRQRRMSSRSARVPVELRDWARPKARARAQKERGPSPALLAAPSSSRESGQCPTRKEGPGRAGPAGHGAHAVPGRVFAR